MSRVSMIVVSARLLRKTQNAVRKSTSDFKKALKATKKSPSEASNNTLVEMFEELEIEVLDARTMIRQAEKQGFKTETLRALVEEGERVMKEKAMVRNEPLKKGNTGEKEGEGSEEEEEENEFRTVSGSAEDKREKKGEEEVEEEEDGESDRNETRRQGSHGHFRSRLPDVQRQRRDTGDDCHWGTSLVGGWNRLLHLRHTEAISLAGQV